jgi:hypothetical protein
MSHVMYYIIIIIIIINIINALFKYVSVTQII